MNRFQWCFKIQKLFKNEMRTKSNFLNYVTNHSIFIINKK